MSTYISFDSRADAWTEYIGFNCIIHTKPVSILTSIFKWVLDRFKSIDVNVNVEARCEYGIKLIQPAYSFNAIFVLIFQGVNLTKHIEIYLKNILVAVKH